MAHGYDVIGSPVETDKDRTIMSLKKEIEDLEGQVTVYRKSVADRRGISETDVHIEAEGEEMNYSINWDGPRERDNTTTRPDYDFCPYEDKSCMAPILAVLRTQCFDDERVIWREPFRWCDDNGVLLNQYEMFEVESVAEGIGCEIVWNFNHAAIVRPV